MNYFKSDRIEEIRSRIINHSVYSHLNSIEDIRVFMEGHVWAVWDFMSLLKFLQRNLTCTGSPWIPTGRSDIRMMINDIVLHEESDPFFNGDSHFDVYVKAMIQAGANADNIMDFIMNIRLDTLEDTVAYSNIPGYKHSMFVEKLIDRSNIEEIAASFSVGREGLIPDMFKSIVKALANKHPEQVKILGHYLNRHIQLDGDEHADMADKLLDLCIVDNESYIRAEKAAIESLLEREKLLDDIQGWIIF